MPLSQPLSQLLSVLQLSKFKFAFIYKIKWKTESSNIIIINWIKQINKSQISLLIAF